MPDFHTLYDAYTVPLRGGRAARLSDAATALASIPDGARIGIPTLSGAPMGLLQALDDERGRWSSMEIVGGILLQPIPPLAHAGEPFRFTSWQFSGPYSEANAAGHVDVIPTRYSQTVGMFGPGGARAVDVVMVQVSPPGPEGRLSLGASGGTTIDMARGAKVLIGQVNAQVPYTFGASELPRDAFDWLVEMDSPIIESLRAEPGEVERRIADHVLDLLPPGATLQFGIGAVPEAIMARLPLGQDFGVHSGLISDGIMEVMESGAVTNARKTDDRDAVICAEAAGGRALFDWLDRNPRVRMAPGLYTHGLSVLSRAHALTALNSAVQVSLDGAINAESVGTRLLSGPGGQPDFAEAALWSVGGVGVIAMPSTAARGKVSRIVPRIDAGAVVTVARHSADRIVTEFGVAELRGRTLRERAERLRAIAHPDFQAALEQAEEDS